MNTSIFQPEVGFALFGALGLKLLDLVELAKVPKAQRPDFKDFIYWLPFILLPSVGGGLAYAYIMSGVELKPLLALNVGASAPLIFRSLAQINPLAPKSIDPGVGA